MTDLQCGLVALAVWAVSVVACCLWYFNNLGGT